MLSDEAAELHRKADHADWLGSVALFEATRSEDDHAFRREAVKHHAEGQRLRELAWAAERAAEARSQNG